MDARFKALRPISAARDIGLRRDQHPRAGDDPLVDRLLDADVGIARPLGAEVALGGEAGVERLARMHHGAGGAYRQWLVQHLIVPLGLVARTEEQVRMALDQARREGFAGQLNHPGARRNAEVRAGRRDPVALDQHRPALVRLRVHPVEDAGGAEQVGVGERG